MAGERDSDLYNVIASGVPGSQMPGFANELNEEFCLLGPYRRNALCPLLPAHPRPVKPP